MKYNLYAVRDRLVGFNAPFIMPNEEVAKRAFKQRIEKDPNAEDLELYRVGNYDDDTGIIVSEQPVMVTM